MTAHPQERPRNALKLTLLADLETPLGQGVKIKAHLSTAWLSVQGMPQHTHACAHTHAHIHSQNFQTKPGKLTGFGHLRKRLCKRHLLTELTKHRPKWCIQKNTDFTELVQKRH